MEKKRTSQALNGGKNAYHEKLLNHIQVLERQLIANDKKLETQNNFFRNLLDSQFTGYWDWHIKENFEYFSPSFKKMLGYEDFEVENHYTAWRKLMHPEDFNVLWMKFKNHVLSMGDYPIECEIRYKHKNGDTVWFFCTAKVIEWSETGQPIRMIGTHINITPVKKAENDLQVRESKFRQIIKNLPRGLVLFVDKEKQIRFADGKSMMKALSLPEVLVHENLENVFPAKIFKKISVAFKAALEGKQKYKEFTQNSNTYYVEATPIADQNKENQEVLLLIVDISDRKKSEDKIRKQREMAVQASQTKTLLLSSLSHEIRTPLNSIIGMTHWLLQDSPREEQVGILKTVIASSENLLEMINDVLDLSKMEANKVELENVDFRLKDLITSIEYSFKYQAEEKKIDFNVRVDENIPEILKGDSVRLVQVLTNIINNGIKFTHYGHVWVDILMVSESATDVVLDFVIEDTGIGIPKEKLKVIFESYTQSNPDIARKYGGTGLGLSISKNLLKLFNSTIEVKSQLGWGSVFSFQIHFDKSTTKTFDQPNSMHNYHFTSLNNLKTLLVDDNNVNREVAAKFLQKWEVDLDFAENGKEAIAMVKKNNYDIVLMDLHMPVMDGFEAVKKIRKLKAAKYRELPILALSVSTLSGDFDKMSDLGFNDYISKPFSPSEFHAKLVRFKKESFKIDPVVNSNLEISDGAEDKDKSLLDFDVFSFLGKDNPGKTLSLVNAFTSSLESFVKEYETYMRDKNISAFRNSVHKVTSTLRFIRADDIIQVAQEGKDKLINHKASDAFVEKSIGKIKQLCEQHIKLLRERLPKN